MANEKGVRIVTEITVKKVTGGWSRWGGGRRGLIKEDVGGVWYCQSCGLPHSQEDSPYMYELFPGEFVRICSRCLSLAKLNHATDFLILKQLVNRKSESLDWWHD